MNDKKQGIIYIIMAGFFFALMTFFVRLSGDLPTMQKAFFRNAVAQVELRTRMEGEELGTMLTISGSKVEGQEAVSCPKGMISGG